jgi:hypothetical protein
MAALFLLMRKPLFQSSKIIGAALCATMTAAGCRSSAPPPISGSRSVSAAVCATQPDLSGLTIGEAIKAVDAMVVPPAGWVEDPRRVDAKHAHLVWKSPTGDTAYGVVLMYLPWPVGPDLVLSGFLNHLRETDQEAQLLSKRPAEDLHGYRFVAESGQYVIRVDLSVRGWRAWAVYAGSLRAKAVNSPELELAERARDHTQVGLPAESAFAE